MPADMRAPASGGTLKVCGSADCKVNSGNFSSMSGAFEFDVFLNSSAEDAPVARALSERLQKDGLRVGFDGSRESVEKALESSRTLVLLLSASALRSECVSMVGQTFRFRDPLNKERRFV